MKKRIGILFAALTLTVVLTGCGATGDNSDTVDDQNEEATQTQAQDDATQETQNAPVTTDTINANDIEVSQQTTTAGNTVTNATAKATTTKAAGISVTTGSDQAAQTLEDIGDTLNSLGDLMKDLDDISDSDVSIPNP